MVLHLRRRRRASVPSAPPVRRSRVLCSILRECSSYLRSRRPTPPWVLRRFRGPMLRSSRRLPRRLLPGIHPRPRFLATLVTPGLGHPRPRVLAILGSCRLGHPRPSLLARRPSLSQPVTMARRPMGWNLRLLQPIGVSVALPLSFLPLRLVVHSSFPFSGFSGILMRMVRYFSASGALDQMAPQFSQPAVLPPCAPP